MRNILPALLASVLCSLVIPTHTARAQGTALTYQGRLNDAAGPASGTYNFQFTVRDALTGGSAVGVNPLAATLAVSNGLFTTTLDPGAGVFTGADRWLEIAVRTNGAAMFTTLSPRQKITAAPYAVTAGAVTGPVNGALITAGSVPDSGLSANVALRSGGNTFSGNQIFNGGNVGIGGTATPGMALEIRGATAAGPSLRLTGVGGEGAKVGIDLATFDPTSFGSPNAGARIEAVDLNYSAHIDFQTKVPGAANNALASRMFIQNAGNVGIGTGTPTTKLEVAGTVKATAFSGDGSQLTGLPSGGGGFSWQVVSGTAQQAQPNTGYVANNASQVTITLPTAPSVGSTVRVTGAGAGGWKIAQNAGQSVSTIFSVLPGGRQLAAAREHQKLEGSRLLGRWKQAGRAC